MNDQELCESFGITLEEVQREIDAVESGDLSRYDFSKTIPGRPQDHDKMRNISAPVQASRIAAMNEASRRQGISRSEFIRRAIDHELLATA